MQLAENLFVEVQGAGTSRPGSRYVAPVRYHDKKTYLIDFRFSTEQAYELEFGEGYVRFYRNRGALLEAAKAITGATQANPVVVTVAGHGWSNGQDVEITAVAGMTELNGRRFRLSAVAANTFALQDQFGNNIDGTAFGAYASGGVAARVYTLATPYLEADLAALRYTQSNDVLYLTHVNYVPRKLIRLGATSWSLEQLDFLDGPYLAQNPGQATLAPAATSGAGVAVTCATSKAITGCANNGAGLIRVTSAGHGWLTNERVNISGVTGTVEANGNWTVIRVNANTYDLRGSAFVNAYAAGGAAIPIIFAASDLGRLVRIKHGATWGYGKIVSFVSVVSVTVDVLSNFGATTAQAAWRLGLYSQTYGYPAACTIYEDRLALLGCPLQPTRGDLSKTGDYENFAPTAVDGTVADDNAIAFALNSGDANAIRWAKDDEKGLLIGTVGGEWLVRSSTLGEALTPSTVKALRATAYGSADLQPVRAGKDVIFTQRGKRKSRNLNYSFEDDGFRAGDVTLLSEHVSRFGLGQAAYQAEPNSIVWHVRGDGQIATTTYSRDQEAIGWCRQVLGGTSDKYGRKFAEVKSVSCIPGPDEVGFDDPWVIVHRYINGRDVQYVEWVTPAWADGDDQQTACFVDSSLVFDGAVAATLAPGAGADVKGAADVVFAAGSAVFAAGDVGRKIVRRYFDWSFRDKDGNRGRYASAIARITAVDSANAVRATILKPFPDLDPIAAGGWRLTVRQVTGLWHLEGQSVQINAEGGAHPDRVVANGAVAFDRDVSYAVVGLGYFSDAQLLRLEAGGADGTAQGKLKRINEVTIRFHATLGAKVGPDFDTLSALPFRRGSDAMDEPPPLQSGDFRIKWEGGYRTEGRICIRRDQPLPMSFQAIMPQVVTSDKG